MGSAARRGWVDFIDREPTFEKAGYFRASRWDWGKVSATGLPRAPVAIVAFALACRGASAAPGGGTGRKCSPYFWLSPREHRGHRRKSAVSQGCKHCPNAGIRLLQKFIDLGGEGGGLVEHDEVVGFIDAHQMFVGQGGKVGLVEVVDPGGGQTDGV